MTFPSETGLPPGRRRSAARRAAREAMFTDLTAFFKAYGANGDSAVMTETFDVGRGSPGERRARADQIAQRIGAAAEWRNGYYMATKMTGGLPVEIQFNPPIFALGINGGAAGEAA